MSGSGLTIEDRFAIVELVARVNQTFDDADPERFIACFAQDGTMEGPRRKAVGHAALARWVEESTARPAHRHCTTNTVVTGLGETGNQASARSCWIYLEYVDGAMTLMSSGTYEDELIKDQGRWLVDRRRAVSDRPNGA